MCNGYFDFPLDDHRLTGRKSIPATRLFQPAWKTPPSTSVRIAPAYPSAAVPPLPTAARARARVQSRRVDSELHPVVPHSPPTTVFPLGELLRCRRDCSRLPALRS